MEACPAGSLCHAAGGMRGARPGDFHSNHVQAWHSCRHLHPDGHGGLGEDKSHHNSESNRTELNRLRTAALDHRLTFSNCTPIPSPALLRLPTANCPLPSAYFLPIPGGTAAAGARRGSRADEDIALEKVPASEVAKVAAVMAFQAGPVYQAGA